MKKITFTLLAVCLFIGLSVPVYAEDGININMPAQEQKELPDVQGGGQQEPQDSPVVVSTLDQLQAAVDAAEDGDIIAISESIYVVNTVLTTEKSITLTRAYDFDKVLLCLTDNSGIEGFTFEETEGVDNTIDVIDSEHSFINNCTFKGIVEHNSRFIEVYCIYAEKTNASIENCIFYGNGKGAISIKHKVETEIKDCTFNNNSTWLQGGAICNDGGSVIIDNCIVTNNKAVSGGGIFNSGDLTITNSRIYTNVITNSKFGSDILSFGTLSIDNYTLENMALYDESTGEKLILPLVDHVGIAKLIYLTEEQAEEYFAPEPPKEEEPIPPEPGDGSNSENTPPEQPQPPQEPGDQTGDDDTTDEEQLPQEPTQPPEGDNNDNPDNGEQGQPQEPVQPPQDNPIEPPTEPEQPPEGEGKDDPAVTPPEAPEQPVEPPQDDSKDDPTDTPITTPDTPQQPTDSGDSEEDDDYTPPVSHRPTHKPSTPVVTPVKPIPITEPEDKPKLSCGGAVIDTSRTIVLLGYGDGDPHEDEPLTRAQLATIIYRLLDDESIALYSNAALSFTDVAADAWYAPYIQTINSAGIVYGVGGGRYDPEGVVNWAQILTILSRFVEAQECQLQNIQYDGWAADAVETAVVLGWITDHAAFNPDAPITRGELAYFVNFVLGLRR